MPRCEGILAEILRKNLNFFRSTPISKKHFATNVNFYRYFLTIERHYERMHSITATHLSSSNKSSIALAWSTLWDARGLLALLGIILHCARIYAPQSFALSDPELHPFYRHLVDAIHAFRMEAFFVFSGAALFMVMSKSSGPILANRTRRLLIPFLFATVLLNLPTLQLIQIVMGTSPTGPSEFNLLSLSFWLSGDWVMHLWFIRNLMIYTLVYCLLTSAPKVFNLMSLSVGKIPKIALIPSVAILLLLPSVIGYLLPSTYNPILGADHGLLGNVRQHLHYGLYFGVGLFIARHPQLLLHLVQSNVRAFVLSISFCAICLILTRGPISESEWAILFQNATLTKVSIELAKQLSVFSLIYLTLQGVAVLQRTSLAVPLRDWAKSSYTIYLVHQPVVWLLALGLHSIALPIALKFLVMVVLTSIICLAFDRVLVLGHIRWTSFMFTGRRSTLQLNKQAA
jgi:glucans biosynthesis protein C